MHQAPPDTALLTKVSKMLRLKKRKEHIAIGFIESISELTISGWTLRDARKPKVLKLFVGDQSFALNAQWVPRQDIAEHYGERYLISGFRCSLPEKILELMKTVHTNSIEAVLEVDSAPLRFLTTGLAEFTISPPISASTEQLGITSCELLGLEVRVCAPGARHEKDLVVTVNGHALEDCVFFPDDLLSDQAKIFRASLPGAIWFKADPERRDRVTVEVLLNGEKIDRAQEVNIDAIEPWILQTEHYVDWEYQRRTLLALEHLICSSSLERLSEDARCTLLRAANALKVAHLLSVSQGKTEADAMRASFSPDKVHSEPVLHDALRTLNHLLQQSASVAVVSKQIFEDRRLVDYSPSVAHGFLGRAIPLICIADELDSTAWVPSLQRLTRDWEDVPTLSLELPIAVHRCKHKRAQKKLKRLNELLAARPPESWLHTECVFAACREIERQATRGLARASAVREDFYADVVDYLAHLNRHGWFGRGADLYVFDTAIHLVGVTETVSEPLRKKIEGCVLSCFGLCFTFWDRLASQLGPDFELSFRLSAARETCLRIRSWTLRFDSLDDKEKQQLLVGLGHFLRWNNSFALQLVRELSMREMLAVNDGSRANLAAYLETLTLSSENELVRVLAAPIPSDLVSDFFGEVKLAAAKRTTMSMYTRTSAHNELRHICNKALISLEQAVKNSSQEPRIPELVSNLQRATYVLAYQHQQSSALEYLLRMQHVLCSFPDTVPLAVAAGGPVWKLLNEHLEALKSPELLAAPAESSLRNLLAQSTDASPLKRLQSAARTAIADPEVHKPNLLSLLNCPQSSELSPTDAWHGDTVVLLYSCRKNLDSKVAGARSVWLSKLEERNIPHLVVVGDGHNQLEDDVLCLGVSDRYEHLPRKTLSMFRWVYEHTAFNFAVKVDDDCVLDVDNFFDLSAYREHHYYGRVLMREPGGMDRAWHQRSSSGPEMQHALDRSPEPSTYADGSTGYALSRAAIARLLENADSATGKKLIASSCMEDKLVGDLLALSNIEPSNYDYVAYVRRKVCPEAEPISMWSNGFHAQSIASTAIVHADTDVSTLPTASTEDGVFLAPKKIFPTHGALSFFKWPANIEIEILNRAYPASLIRGEGPRVVSCVRNERAILPHFLSHYRKLGVQGFFIVDNISDDGTREYLLQQPDVLVMSTDSEYRHSHYGVSWQQAILGNFCLGRWVIVADADEFLVFPGFENTEIASYISALESDEADCVLTPLVDMYPRGSLNEVDFWQHSPLEAANCFDSNSAQPWFFNRGPFSNHTASTSCMRARVFSDAKPGLFTNQKFTLFRYTPWIRLAEGLHHIFGYKKLATARAHILHFKYDKNFLDKCTAEVLRGQHFDGASEYRLYAELAHSNPDLSLYDNELSTVFSDSRGLP